MSWYLEYIRIERYGAVEGRSVGPFAPGLNVVFGPNEAGKSTVASFVGGVLFGWDDAHGARNAYLPRDGERSGSLLFASTDGEDGLAVAREHAEAGLQGDASLVDDIDSATYRSMFSLSSDELRSLRNTSDVTARLMAAESGMGSSPAEAFAEIEQRIAALTSQSEDDGESLAVLSRRIEEAGERVRLAREANDLLKLQCRERDELAESRFAAMDRLEELTAELENLKALRVRVGSIDDRLAELQTELYALRGERADCSRHSDRDKAIDERLVDLDTSTDRALRDRLDELSEERAKVSRGIDIAKENSAASAAAYDAFLEMNADDAAHGRKVATRATQMIAAIVLPVAFALLGGFTFLHGRTINSLSFTAFGIALVFVALLFAAGAAFVLFRPNHDEEVLESRRKDAQWVMLQDKKKLESALASKAALDQEMAAFFAESGLGDAGTSVRHARALLDDAREMRAQRAQMRQRVSSLDMRIGQGEDAVATLLIERESLLRPVELHAASTLAEIDALIRRTQEARDAQAQACDEMSRRLGELTSLLDGARKDASFDRLKSEQQVLLCRMRESKRELVVLLLAKRMLEKAISAWESTGRPEVFSLASRLFESVTDGAWARIAMTSEGQLVACTADGEMREVKHLSLGTCQQLYLSMRVAMLLLADSVGRAIPVLADDILVHFDDGRRRAAARMLAELAEKRQVIVFTCHRETVEALRRAASGLNYIDL